MIVGLDTGGWGRWHFYLLLGFQGAKFDPAIIRCSRDQGANTQKPMLRGYFSLKIQYIPCLDITK